MCDTHGMQWEKFKRFWKSCEIRRIIESKIFFIYFEIEKMEFSLNQLMRF
jgi:hypothetical protein